MTPTWGRGAAEGERLLPAESGLMYHLSPLANWRAGPVQRGGRHLQRQRRQHGRLVGWQADQLPVVREPVRVQLDDAGAAADQRHRPIVTQALAAPQQDAGVGPPRGRGPGQQRRNRHEPQRKRTPTEGLPGSPS